MKLNEDINDVQVLNQSETIEFGIDKEDEWVIFKSFINYSDPIGSMIREIVSNAYDAHVEAGVKEDVIVRITEENSTLGTSSTLTVEDKGNGLSPEVIRKVYSRFGKSTKRETSDQIGAYGFGAKSPLSYNNMFELITTVDGVRYFYAVHKGEKKLSIDKMDETKVDQPNGTKVVMYIKEGDLYKFKQSIRKNLQYFDGITYENCDINNDYEIIRGEHFIYNTACHETYMHLCLGKVRYPLNSDLVERIKVPVGLYFDIGEIPVVWNRENVEYTDEAVEKINQKIEDVRHELQGLYDEQYQQINNLTDFVKVGSESDIFVHEKNGTKYYIPDRWGFIDKTPFYPKYNTLTVRHRRSLYGAFEMEANISSWSTTSHFDIQDNLAIIPRGHSRSGLIDSYLKDEKDKTFLLRKVNKEKAVRAYMDNFYKFNFSSHPYDIDKDIRQKVVKEAYQLYDEVVEWVESNSEQYKEIDIPEDYIEEYQEQERLKRERRKKQFYYLNVKVSGSFNSHRINGNLLKNVFKNDTVIYGFQDDREALREIKHIIQREYRSTHYKNIKVIQISIQNEDVVREVLGNKAFYISEVEKIPAIQRIGRKYNQAAWVRRLYDAGLDVGKKTDFDSVPKYVNPETPTQQEKLEFYKYIGEKVKYPLLEYLSSIKTPPKEVIKKYKEQSPNHNINPILIGKQYVKDYENKCIEE